MPGEMRAICKYSQARQILPLILAFVLFLTLVPTVHAHKVYLFAWLEGDTVYTESYFSGRKKVKGGLIKVFDLSGNKLLEGKSNEKGEFSFKIPQRTDLQIVLEATMGHRAEYILRVDDSTEATSDLATTSKGTRVPSPSAIQADLEQIRMVVEESLDTRLKPIMRTLAEVQEERGPGLTEIIGGIGYIFGLMGLILYFKSRKKSNPHKQPE